jgi:predicted enzyme related to lactoylglutathione lyase
VQVSASHYGPLCKAVRNNAPSVAFEKDAPADTPIAKGPMSVLVVPVDDLEKMTTVVERNGGQVLERRAPVPGIGWFASCAEPGVH